MSPASSRSGTQMCRKYMFSLIIRAQNMNRCIIVFSATVTVRLAGTYSKSSLSPRTVTKPCSSRFSA
ncbi:hypothetical protein [Streptomyces sp. SR-10]|uniref:hypothetical protein n=1 Tax=Streptomyces sp. SR-10 TaxID=3416442 RepID=UPI003CF3F747